MPQIHCTSCVWLLERLPRLAEGVQAVTVNFSRRTATIVFRHNTISFRELADAIRNSSINLTAGTIRSKSGRLVVKTRGQAYRAAEFEQIPIRAADGSDVLLGEVAKVNDGEAGKVAGAVERRVGAEANAFGGAVSRLDDVDHAEAVAAADNRLA